MTYRHYQQLIDECDREVQQRLESFNVSSDGPPAAPVSSSSAEPKATFDLPHHLERIFGTDLTLIPGFESLRVQTLFSELGANLLKFPTSDSFCSWLNLCPKDGTSAGRRVRTHRIKAKNRAADAFRLAAQCLHRSKSLLGGYFRSQRSRFGSSQATKNAAHKLARIFYCLVTRRQPYDDNVFLKLETRHQKRRLNKLQSLARQMGYSLVQSNASPAVS